MLVRHEQGVGIAAPLADVPAEPAGSVSGSILSVVSLHSDPMEVVNLISDASEDGDVEMADQEVDGPPGAVVQPAGGDVPLAAGEDAQSDAGGGADSDSDSSESSGGVCEDGVPVFFDVEAIMAVRSESRGPGRRRRRWYLVLWLEDNVLDRQHLMQWRRRRHFPRPLRTYDWHVCAWQQHQRHALPAEYRRRRPHLWVIELMRAGLVPRAEDGYPNPDVGP